MMDYWQEANGVNGRQELASFLVAASQDFKNNPDDWENRDIPDLLESMAAWILDCDQFFHRNGQSLPSNEAWATIAKVIAAARLYE